MGRKAGCVPVRRREGSSNRGWEVLLVQSRWTPAIWLFPKGGIEAGESAKAAATRETVEEGGVVGDLGPKLGCWNYERGNNKQKQKMWMLFVTTEYGADNKLWKERKKRRRAWLSFSEARRRLSEVEEEIRRPELVEMLDKAETIVKGIGSGSLPIGGSSAAESDED